MISKQCIQFILGSGAAVFGFAAALLWLWASLQNVKPTDSKRSTGAILISMPNESGEDSDVLATAARQTYWNARAALCASIAAMCQLPLVFLQ